MTGRREVLLSSQAASFGGPEATATQSAMSAPTPLSDPGRSGEARSQTGVAAGGLRERLPRSTRMAIIVLVVFVLLYLAAMLTLAILGYAPVLPDPGSSAGTSGGP